MLFQAAWRILPPWLKDSYYRAVAKPVSGPIPAAPPHPPGGEVTVDSVLAGMRNSGSLCVAFSRQAVVAPMRTVPGAASSQAPAAGSMRVGGSAARTGGHGPGPSSSGADIEAAASDFLAKTLQAYCTAEATGKQAESMLMYPFVTVQVRTLQFGAVVSFLLRFCKSRTHAIVYACTMPVTNPCA